MDDNFDPIPIPQTIKPELITGMFSGLFVRLVQALIDNKQILLIKEIRAATGLPLLEAKDVADSIFTLFQHPQLANSWDARNAEVLRKENEALCRRLEELIDQKAMVEEQLDQKNDQVQDLEFKVDHLQQDVTQAEDMYERAGCKLEAYRTVLQDTVLNKSFS